jgi:four helix bundle protein
MPINSFRDLRVWQISMDFVEIIYRHTRQFPKHEVYGLTSQIQRAAVSIPSNIAEGHTREHLKEYLHHISMSQASLAELETQLEIATRLEYISKEDCADLSTRSSALGKQLYALRNALIRSSNT